MHYERKVDKFLIVVIPIVLFVYASTRPIAHLRTEMPPQFVDVPASATRKQRAEEERRAQAYWNCTLTFIQWRYTYGSPLPDDPPSDFRVGGEAQAPTGAAGADPAPSRGKGHGQGQGAEVRRRYWRRLRQVWVSPDCWSSSREWSTEWLTEPVMGAVKWVENYVSDLTRSGR